MKKYIYDLHHDTEIKPILDAVKYLSKYELYIYTVVTAYPFSNH